ncbi:MAG TPA: glycosyltransferase family 2 protein [Mycobacteriales bacterium]|nr:glycosyltransferase family 2 protein [Mycobacteriales bacterium]
MGIECSVVIPVFNRGDALAAGAESLRAQTIGADNLQIIYVDDGSNDGRTPGLLDDLVAGMPNATVFHEPPSGSPGRPRNVGLHHARGEFVFFSDHDDWFEPEALEAMVGYARANNSDVVIGKVVAHGRRTVIPRLFRQSRAQIDATEAMISLTPHKLFRRELLATHAITYPEGKRRLEDHVFVTHAYLHARTISVYADRICYHHNHPGEAANFSQTVSDPKLYSDSNLEVVELIRRHVDDPDRRDALVTRPLRHELLKKAVLTSGTPPDPAAAAHKHHVHRSALLAIDSPGAIDRLGAFSRATAKALLDDDPEAVARVGAHAAGMSLRAAPRRITKAGAVWTIEFEATVVHDKQPVMFHKVAEHSWRLDDAALPAADTDRPEREADLLNLDLEILLASRATSEQWHLPASYDVALRPARPRRFGTSAPSPAILTITGTTTVDLANVGGRQIGFGTWDIVLRTDTLGVELGNRFVPDASGRGGLPRHRLTDPAARARMIVTERRRSLAIVVKPAADGNG